MPDTTPEESPQYACPHCGRHTDRKLDKILAELHKMDADSRANGAKLDKVLVAVAKLGTGSTPADFAELNQRLGALADRLHGLASESNTDAPAKP